MGRRAIEAISLDALVARVGRADYQRFEEQLRSSNYCARPIRLRGRIERCEANSRRVVWSTDDEPDGVLRKACGDRREAICPSCAERYRQDAYHLIAAGLRGGKTVPETVADHPAVFVTLTAPSFGAVHTRRHGPAGKPLRCRPRRDADTCPHGVRLSCGNVHELDDGCLGQPLCPECFDHRGAVVWNNALSELWRRTSIYVPRALARLTGMTQSRVRELVRVSYVKVAEYQQRGLIHLHVVIRLDRRMPAYRRREMKPPARRFTVELLEEAIRAAAATARAPLPDELGGGAVRWGDELDTRHIDGLERRKVAGYLAKYTTKSTEAAGGVVHRIAEHQVESLPVSEHVRCYARAAFALAADPALADRRYGRHAHALGFRGHCVTKSHGYSTTFKALREAREHYVCEQLLKNSDDDANRELAAAGVNERIKNFTYVGRGHLTSADAFLALSAAARAREQRAEARDALWQHRSPREEARCESPQR